MSKNKREFVGLGRAVDRARRGEALNQVDLAERLGVSQPHLCKVLKEAVMPSNRLALKMKAYLGGKQLGDRGDAWADAVLTAARNSQSFRDLLSAALSLMNKK